MGSFMLLLGKTPFIRILGIRFFIVDFAFELLRNICALLSYNKETLGKMHSIFTTGWQYLDNEIDEKYLLAVQTTSKNSFSSWVTVRTAWSGDQQTLQYIRREHAYIGIWGEIWKYRICDTFLVSPDALWKTIVIKSLVSFSLSSLTQIKSKICEDFK